MLTKGDGTTIKLALFCIACGVFLIGVMVGSVMSVTIEVEAVNSCITT